MAHDLKWVYLCVVLTFASAASNDLLLPKVTEFSEVHVNSDMLGAGSEVLGTMSLKSGAHSSVTLLSLYLNRPCLSGSWNNCSSQKA